MSDSEGARAGESLGKLKFRHKTEVKNLKTEIKALERKAKKNKTPKAELKFQIRAMEQALATRHKSELEAHHASSSEEAEMPPVAVKAAAAEPSRAQRRRLKQQKRRQADEALIAKEKEAQVDYKGQEMESFAKHLGEEGMTLEMIPADGSCLFAAICLRLPDHDVASLRRLAADTILKSPDLYGPFVVDAAGMPVPREALAEYCHQIATDPSAWGSEVELQALAAALNRQIDVHMANGDVRSLGAEQVSGGMPIIHISFHQHYVSTGAHYNAVVEIPRAVS